MHTQKNLKVARETLSNLRSIVNQMCMCFALSKFS